MHFIATVHTPDELDLLKDTETEIIQIISFADGNMPHSGSLLAALLHSKTRPADAVLLSTRPPKKRSSTSTLFDTQAKGYPENCGQNLVLWHNNATHISIWEHISQPPFSSHTKINATACVGFTGPKDSSDIRRQNTSKPLSSTPSPKYA